MVGVSSRLRGGSQTCDNKVCPTAAEQRCAAFTECMGGPSDDGLDPHGEKGFMNPENPTKDRAEESQGPPRRVRLPGFLIEEEIGLGDAIKRATYAVGIKPCSGCEKRAATLNRWMTFSR